MLLEAVIGEPEDEGITSVLLAVPIVEFSVDVRVLVSVRVDEECSSVQVVVYTEVWFEVSMGDEAVEFADPDGIIEIGTVTVVTIIGDVELAELTGPAEETDNPSEELLGCTVVVLVTGIVTIVVSCVVSVPVPVGRFGMKLPDELVKTGADEPLAGKPLLPPVPVVPKLGEYHVAE